jgi:uncharacterized protein YxjI
MNLFQDVGDLLSGGKLVPQTDLPHGTPLEPSGQISDQVRTLAVSERPLSLTGEDFDVWDVTSNKGPTLYAKVRGAIWHLPGKDRMRIYDGKGRVVAELDRKIVALTATYDIYRPDGNKLGWIEKAPVALTDTFEVHVEEQQGWGLLKPPAAYRIEGDFADRNFCVKGGRRGDVAAKIQKKGWIQFDEFNHYQIQVAAGMDAGLVLACAVAIDEEFDEEHKKRREDERKRKERNGERENVGWFG